MAFKAHAHALLPKGGKFRYRILHEAGELLNSSNRPYNMKNITLHRTEAIEISNTVNFDDRELSSRKYLKPQSGNFEAADSGILRDSDSDSKNIPRLFQMTCNVNHGVNGKTLDALIDKLKARMGSTYHKVKLTMVVPLYMFEQFGCQSYNKDDFTNSKNFKLVEQSVIGLPTD